MFDTQICVAKETDFRKVYDANITLLLKVVTRIVNDVDVAEDLVHDSLIKMHERGLVFPSMDDVKYWLLRVVKNAALNYVKRRNREKLAYEKFIKTDGHEVETGETHLLRNDTQQKIKSSLEKLPLNLKVVLILREYAELNYKEIGKILDITEGNVKVRVFRAREQLAKLIGEEDVYLPK